MVWNVAYYGYSQIDLKTALRERRIKAWLNVQLHRLVLCRLGRHDPFNPYLYRDPYVCAYCLKEFG